MKPEYRRLLRSYFDDRDGLVKELLDALEAHEKRLDQAREALDAIATSEDLTLLEVKKRASKALEKLNA